MILDNIKNLEKYEKIHEQIKNIVNFLENFDEDKFEDGRVDINENLFSFFQSYQTVKAYNKEFEVHEKYIDLQYLVDSNERIDFAPKKSYTKNFEIDKEGDFFLTNEIENYSILNLKPGDFAIFFPGEFHKPGCALENPSSAKKIVFKIKA